MSTQKQKFRNLYYVIIADDVNELSNYFNEFPNEDPCNKKLTIGKKYDLFSHALDSNSPECAKFLIELLNLEQMDCYTRAISKSYKHHQDILECYLAKLKILTEQANNTNIITSLLFAIIQEKHVIPKELVQDIIEIPHYDFENKLRNNIDNTRKNLESIMKYCKNAWIIYFIEYYISKNIDFKQLAVKLLLYNNGINVSTYWKVIKKYWTIHDNSKFKIEFVEHDGESKNEYTLEFIIFITGQYTDINEFRMFTDNTFEEKFNNYISENKFFHNSTSNLFSSIASINSGEYKYYFSPFSHHQIQILKTIFRSLSNNFFLKLKEIYQIQIDIYREHRPNITYEELPDELKYIDELHKEFIELTN